MRIHSCQLAVGRLERSHVPGQAVIPMGPPPEGSQPPAVPPGDPPQRGVTAWGADTPTQRGGHVGFLIFSPLPSSHHLPNSHAPTPASCVVRKEGAPGGHAGTSSHLGTLRHSPRLARHLLIPQAPKSKLSPFLPVAKG